MYSPRVARLLTAVIVFGVAVVDFSRADDAKPQPAPKQQKAPAAPEQLWEGKLNIGAGLSLRLVVHVRKTDEGKLTATMDSPDQGAKGLKVDHITLDKKTLAFEMKAILGKYEGTLNTEGTQADGTWTQAGRDFPLILKVTDKLTELRRPQTPKPPFPYKVIEVSYPNKSGGVTLAGTLTEPESPGPFPALILISGSGAQDRDETIFEHKPFLVLADALTRRGVAVLRIDDRGVGGSTGNTMKSTSDDFAGDVLAGIAFLKDPQRDRRHADWPDGPQRRGNHRSHGRLAVVGCRVHHPHGRYGAARGGNPLLAGSSHSQGHGCRREVLEETTGCAKASV